eukprot:602503-Pyramimonas_sp.AAC.1
MQTRGDTCLGFFGGAHSIATQSAALAWWRDLPQAAGYINPGTIVQLCLSEASWGSWRGRRVHLEGP